MKVHSVTHISQQEKPHSDLACGVASFAMLLKYFNSSAYEYEKLCNELQVTKTPYQKGFSWGSEHLGNGVYFQDIIKWLQDNKYKFVASNIRTMQNFRAITQLIKHVPIMVGISSQSSGHWVVLVGIDNGTFKYLDPYLKTGKLKDITKKYLFEDWDGTCIALGEKPE